MLRNLWTKIQSATDFWRFGGTLPGVTAIAVVVVARLVGLLQFQEWAAFDTFMRLRLVEPLDERILIVGINEEDIQRIKKYPIPDHNLAALLQSLQTYQPTVIGLDIFRDLPQEPGNAELISTLKGIKNLIAIKTIVPDRNGSTVNPPPALLPKQIGFADAPIDLDGKQRRSFLGAFNRQNDWQYSFSLLLAKTYLETKEKFLENASDDGYSMRFHSTIIPRFLPNSGGYIRAKVSGTEMLINLRSNRTPFRIVSLEQIQTRKIEANWIRGKIILIGIINPSAKDYVTSAATKSENSSLIYGVEIQAHVVSQIVSAVLDERPLLNTWADIWEYLWIVAWGMLGITFGRTIRSPFRILFLVAIASIGLLGICYGLLIVGWWIPVVPACLILVFNSAIIAAFYQYEEVLQLRITNRQLVIVPATVSLATYNPPKKPSPPPPPQPVGSNNGTRTNGCSGQGQTTLTTLAPLGHVGQTASTQPTFAWFVPDTQPHKMEFSLYDYGTNDNGKPIKSIELQSTPGIMKLSLPKDINISVGKKYRWQIALVCDENNPVKNLYAEAPIMVVAIPTSLANTLAQTTDHYKRSQLYAQAEFWYDALSEALADPKSKALRLTLLSELSKLEETTSTSDEVLKKDLQHHAMQLRQIVALEQKQN